MSLLTTNPIQGLIKESDAEIQIFTNALTRIQNINKKIRFQVGKRVEAIDKLQGEKELLEATEAKNDKFYAKLSTFLDD